MVEWNGEIIEVVVLGVSFPLFRRFQTFLDSSITFSAVSDTKIIGDSRIVE